MGAEKRQPGESVATMWARLLGECQHGPVAIENKHGEVVAVMISYEHWQLINDLEEGK